MHESDKSEPFCNGTCSAKLRSFASGDKQVASSRQVISSTYCELCTAALRSDAAGVI